MRSIEIRGIILDCGGQRGDGEFAPGALAELDGGYDHGTDRCLGPHVYGPIENWNRAARCNGKLAVNLTVDDDEQVCVKRWRRDRPGQEKRLRNREKSTFGLAI